MLRTNSKWRADHGARALRTVSEVEASIAALAAEDLLDLQDIFAGSPDSVLWKLATSEVERRGLIAHQN